MQGDGSLVLAVCLGHHCQVVDRQVATDPIADFAREGEALVMPRGRGGGVALVLRRESQAVERLSGPLLISNRAPQREALLEERDASSLVALQDSQMTRPIERPGPRWGIRRDCGQLQ